jgi:hypothetical protein
VKSIWKDKPDDHDFASAQAYLTLLFDEAAAKRIVAKLRKASCVEHEAKDLLRASRLPLLADDNSHVVSDLKKIRKDRKLSPVLLVRGSAENDVPLLIADGYHRICASWHHDENTRVFCRIVSA